VFEDERFLFIDDQFRFKGEAESLSESLSG
jgi:hypothetical protein